MAKKLPFAKADFLTIPDAPNYEINGYFKVRNKTTGHIIKNQKWDGYKGEIVPIYSGGKRIKRTAEMWYLQATSAILDKETYTPINSLQNKYELNCWGEVFNGGNVKVKAADSSPNK